MDGSPIFETRYLHWVSTECCQVFKSSKGHNNLYNLQVMKCFPCYMCLVNIVNNI